MMLKEPAFDIVSFKHNKQSTSRTTQWDVSNAYSHRTSSAMDVCVMPTKPPGANILVIVF
jgi:hypothetical protein